MVYIRTPLIKQQEMKDCAVACIAMVLKYYGQKISLAKIREVAGTDRYGTTALGIINAATSLDMKGKAVSCKTRESIFDYYPKPAIAHVSKDGIEHFVVIYKVTKKYILIADPVGELKKYTIDQFFKIFTGNLIILTPDNGFKKKDEDENSFLRFLSLLKHEKQLLVQVFIISALVTCFGIVISFYSKYIFDEIAPNNLKHTLLTLSIGMLIIISVKALLEFFKGYLLIYIGNKLNIPIMFGYYEHVLKLPLKFFETRQKGDIISRFNDASRIREAISSIVLTMTMDLVMIVGVGIVLYIQSRTLFFVTLLQIFLYAIFAYLYKNPIEKASRNSMIQNSEVTSYFIESLSGIETIKAFNSEKNIEQNGEFKFIELLKRIFKEGILLNSKRNIDAFIKGIFSIIFLWVGVLLVMDGTLTFGSLITFQTLFAYFLTPIENIINIQSTVQSALVASDRLCEVIDLKVEKEDSEISKIDLNECEGNISFENVTFRYGGRQKVLDNLSLNIKKGEKVAIIGESGSGKTTLAKLLLRFYEPEGGRIKIDNYDISDISIESLRNRVAYMSQDIYLFPGTLKENITMLDNTISASEIINACRNVNIADFIDELPMRYNTLIEEDGSNLSTGQKQRIALARALLKDGDIYILDEATSNLDSVTESSIQKAIEINFKDKTIIIIAHRLSTIKNCNKIIVMEKGKICEVGTHEELMGLKERYYNYVCSQIE